MKVNVQCHTVRGSYFADTIASDWTCYYIVLSYLLYLHRKFRFSAFFLLSRRLSKSMSLRDNIKSNSVLYVLPYTTVSTQE